MSHRHRCLFAGLLLSIAGFSCKKVIQVNLNAAAPQIVIEGNITNGPGPSQFMISRTVDFSATNQFPPVSGATVTITDSTNFQTETLREMDSGLYITQSLTGIPTHTYLLKVVADGKT